MQDTLKIIIEKIKESLIWCFAGQRFFILNFN